MMSREKSGCEEAGESTIKRQKVEENGVRVFTKYKTSTIVTAISCRSATAILKRDEKKYFPVKQCLHFKAQRMAKLKSYLKTHKTLEAFNKSSKNCKNTATAQTKLCNTFAPKLPTNIKPRKKVFDNVSEKK